MELDFAFTCGDIDKQIDVAKSEIVSMAISLLSDYNVIVSDEEVEGECQWAISNVKECFEVLRRLNEDMRAQANLQLTELEVKLEEVELELESLKDQINEYENTQV